MATYSYSSDILRALAADPENSYASELEQNQLLPDDVAARFDPPESIPFASRVKYFTGQNPYNHSPFPT